ncbi:unannotated protein [freshwater metagenome]|uniref:Unannotated protein n=1 Tax=freshwater metagenome TaxID=449393 RepID=A0A6J7PID2_9ZZZZ
MYSRFFKLAAPRDVVFFIEARLDFNDGQNLLTLLSCGD